MVYIRQELERAIIRNYDEGVGEVVNEILQEGLIERGDIDEEDFDD